ncbi:hypothetical protein HPB50_020676 [Hyalomma asiaticum]|uniref:Uncharacterized protein n=1 Tax=Hyalomma asiaticum TaxID=266040 RepID=A0ACB7SGY8_HYAAI|nr:hypothetical protein HPB50_020676 [Hyalomma asiaticum]
MCRWNPDVPVAWELVHEVRVLQQQSTTGQEERCPVCLGTPRAAQTPPCGHVYCWSCLLHYLALSDRPYRPCPICDRPVVPQPRRGYQPGDEITMCLMRRQKNQPGAQPMPADLWRVDDLEPFNINREERLTCHQRVLVACPKQLGAMLDREESELRSQLLEEGDAPEACFVQAALQANSHQMRGRERCISSGSSGAEDSIVGAEDLEMPVCTATNAGSNNNGCREGIPGGDSFYYFQAADGQPVFLHALNARMLVHEYGALELAPVKFTARIVEIEGASIDNELRRRLRYLRHLPLTCEIQVVEVQLEPPVIKQATTEHFAADVEKRRRQRSRRARNEKRQDRLRAKEEMRRQGYVSDLDERQQVTPSSSGVLAEEGMSPTPAGSSANRVSFAQMVQTRSAGAAGGFCRRLPATGSSAPKTVAAAGSDADDDEEYCPVPQYRQSFSQALEEALNAAAAASAAAHADSAHSPDGQKDKPGSKKKKKKNVTLLFATSMNRSK